MICQAGWTWMEVDGATLALQPYGEEGTWLIGHYEAEEAEAAVELLQRAKVEARKAGARRLVGPIDGDTWHRYRISYMDGLDADPLFLGEPTNPVEWHTQWLEAGFAVDQSYFSAVMDLGNRECAVSTEHLQRMEAAGVQIEQLNLARLDEQLRAVYEISCVSFQGNPYYREISFEAFMALYEPLKPLMQAEFSFLARHGERIVGFGFAYPDLLCQTRRRLLFKSIAVLPEFRSCGIGRIFFDRVHQAAQQAGFDQVVHALMHENNRSRDLSCGRYGARIFRRYALYGVQL